MTDEPSGPKGRGAADNPANRFDGRSVEPEEPPPRSVATEIVPDRSRSIIARNDSPDVPFDVSVNPYRGCEHGCSYCYARPTHENLGYSAGLDFETRIVVKERAPELLEAALGAPSWRPKVVAMSGVTDPYQPLERELRLTRGCLEVFAETRNPVAIVTKNRLVLRDEDLLGELASYDAAAVSISVTTLDPELSRRMEPRASRPRDRLETVARLNAAGIPCGVLVAPVVPGLTDHEIPRILDAAADAGAVSASMLLLRLPGAVAPIFSGWLDRHFPERKEKILGRIRELRHGRLDDPRFGHRMRGSGVWAEQIERLFTTTRERLGIASRGPELSVESFRRPGGQMGLFEEG